MVSSVLEKIGLSRNEGIVYSALLRLGTSRTGEILKKSGLNSGKIYEILEGLKRKGLASESIINNTRHFTAAPPSRLLELVERKKQSILEEEALISRMLPELEKIRNEKTKDTLAFTYVGFKGFKAVALEALSSLNIGNEILAMGIVEGKAKKFNNFWEKFAQERIRLKIPARHLFSEKGARFNAFKKMRLTKARFLPGLTPTAVDVFGQDKVLILNHSEPVTCILIHDKNTALSFRNFFEQLWKLAKP